MSNDFYNHVDGTIPTAGARGVSSLIRTEFEMIEDGFDIAQNYAVDSGTTNAMVIAPPAALTALTDGLVFRIKAADSVNGATTINLGATLGTKSLKMQDGTEMSGEIIAGQIFECVWDATAGYLKFMSGGVPGASNGLPTTGGTMTGAINEAKGANIASAATVDLSTATGNLIHITGTTTITAITLQSGAERTVVFDGALTLTHHATTLILPGAANITTATGDVAVFRGDGLGNTRCVSYIKASGASVISPTIGDIETVLTTGNGHGAVNTKVRRFTTTERNTATAWWTLADSANDGMSITAVQACTVIVEYTDVSSGGGDAVFGISVNSNQLTTAIESITASHRKGLVATQSGYYDTCTAPLQLAIGDVVRAHTAGAVNGAAATVRFCIRKIGGV